MIEQPINLIEAAKFLIMAPETLRRKIKSGAIPASKTGKGWALLRVDLIAYLRSKYEVADNFYINDVNREPAMKKRTGRNRVATYPAQRKIDKEYIGLLKNH